ncbi:tail fiber domain-containing protein (plasmid) [Roseovarius faecimaris]|uniref:Tail fiber domain-containing protein n=1 Tax=Roseovarius faecimaris TaxID=2494550 RepID=A0A6I6IVK9_9RHOB|nr:tail fiber domain-containing protein [Roseovarius faecimaris]QGX96788.1 tail fiber domain-containing protein [Roseovarius faecimaris]
MTHTPLRLLLVGTGALALSTGLAQADQVILDDLIVDGSACIGLDCVNGESFGFDTIRIKENNLRIKAQDTSSSASFPTNDWQITFNESSNGGANKFSIEDIDGGATPFTIEAGAASHALYVDDGERIGLSTSTPVVELHIVDGDTPTMRLEQNGSSGFTPQTWDVAGNETNLFIRDVTNGSKLPFRIRPNAPTSSIDVEGTTGDIGVGTTSPTAPIHVVRSNGTAKVLIEENSSTTAARGLLELRNSGTTFLTLADEGSGGETWNIQSNSGEFRFTNATGAGIELAMTTAGDMTISGTLTENSDKNAKMAIVPVDPQEVLQKVAALPVSSWMYKDNADLGIRHMGPMAQDFHAAFGLGASDKGISSLDTSGVALAAIQALASENAELKARIARLEDKLAE